ncbi:MAG TPA: hypothetical protein OIM60_03630 [Clostridiaceae bacterium]|nr:hypothetical protein [Clostridiaceae bacterium]
MEFSIKPTKTSRQDGMLPQTIEQLIKKYKLDSMWENIQKIVKEIIEQNSVYVVKKDGIMYIADTNVLEEAKTVLRIGKNALDISNNGINGEYQTIISLNGIINADFITAGTLSANRIKGGTLKLGGENNTNGSLQVLSANGEEVVNIGKEGIELHDGTTIIGNGGVLSNLSFSSMDWKEIGYSIFTPSQSTYKYINIGVFIPSNFVVTSAYLVLQLHPINYSYKKDKQVGYSRNVNLFYEKLLTGNVTPFNVEIASENYDYRLITNNTNAINCTGEEGKLNTYISNNIGNFLTSGQGTLFQLRTSDAVPTENIEWDDYDKNRAARTGYVRAMINVYGFLK